MRRNYEENAKLTHRTFLGVEYQSPTDKFDAIYNGPMYNIFGHHTDCLVTANHRMLFRKIERRSGKEYDWILEEASALPDTFEILITPTPKKKSYCNKDIFKDLPISPKVYMRLMGWYLSDGNATFKDNKFNIVKNINISQKPKGKIQLLKWYRKYNKKISCSFHRYTRKSSSFNPKEHEEETLKITNKVIRERIVKDCGYKEFKRIPRYAFSLSKYLMDTLLYGLIQGDGTLRQHKTKDDSFIYYSSSKKLADDVQELALMAGWETALYGPYKHIYEEDKVTYMYQVHLRPIIDNVRKFIRSSNVKKIDVKNQRVVCFTVPNGTLITRRNGKVAIHGNCKHGLHLCRLLVMGKEILETGNVIVKRPDREFLLSIRNGAWNFEKIIEWAEKQEQKLNELYKTSKLPNTPNRAKIDNLCIELIEEFLKNNINN